MIKAYFIGGPLDLTIRMLESPERVFRATTTPRLLTPVTPDNAVLPMETIEYTYRIITTVRNWERPHEEVYVYALDHDFTRRMQEQAVRAQAEPVRELQRREDDTSDNVSVRSTESNNYFYQVRT